MFVGNEEVLYQPSDNRITLYPCRINYEENYRGISYQCL
jgi:hypothetical protein